MLDNLDSQKKRWDWFEHLISLKIGELITQENKIINEELTFKNKLIGTYILIHSKTRQIYIGSTDDLYERRYKHLWHIKRKDHRNRKVQEAFLLVPSEQIYFFIFPTKTREESFDLEQKFLNSYYDNPKCLNIASDARLCGNDRIYTDEQRKNISETVKKQWKNPEYKKLKSRITKAYLSIPENKAKMIKNLKISTNKIEYKNSQSKKAIIQWSDPELRRKKSEEVKKYLSNPINKQKSIDSRKHLIKPISINNVIYSSRKEAASKLNLSIVTVTKHILNKNKPSWFYINKEKDIL